jgi:hypothetical protein
LKRETCEPTCAICGWLIPIDGHDPECDVYVAAMTTLGLDDLDAAVERGAAALIAQNGLTRIEAVNRARVVVEAALLRPQEAA